MKSLPLKRIDLKRVDFVDQAYRENNVEVMKEKGDSTAANESKTLEPEPAIRVKKRPLASTSKDPEKKSIEVGLDSKDKLYESLESKLQRSGKVPRFEERLRLLKKFKEKHGHCNVPKSYTEKGIGEFSNYVRLVNAGLIEELKHPELKLTKEERMEKLQKLGFRWRFQHSWDEYFRLLQSFKAKTGHCNVPKSDKLSLEYPGLVTWVCKMRDIRDGRRNKLRDQSYSSRRKE
ncbi:hypothetical protein CTEN210_03620 [Chaetoceros tenuissimus]|uniref:Helicase-associated domain-containing protein n=1 Tax=Chaetoceros tenuissimus TaxID=426638 RepID=A0AAD3CM13_9STRA|nr:hypothetical protein CTEN210_03620 [Chaetoceros tenuissimus]